MIRLIPWAPVEEESSGSSTSTIQFDIVNDYPGAYDGGYPESPQTFNIDDGYPNSKPVFTLDSQL